MRSSITNWKIFNLFQLALFIRRPAVCSICTTLCRTLSFSFLTVDKFVYIRLIVCCTFFFRALSLRSIMVCFNRLQCPLSLLSVVGSGHRSTADCRRAVRIGGQVVLTLHSTTRVLSTRRSTEPINGTIFWGGQYSNVDGTFPWYWENARVQWVRRHTHTNLISIISR